MYTLAYDGNGAAPGPAPASVTAAVGAPLAVAANTFARDGYTFNGWNTQPDGSGFGFWPGNSTSMPYLGGTLYAQWAPNPSYPLAATDDWYATQYNTPLVVGVNESILGNDGPSAFPMVVTRVYNEAGGYGTLEVNFTTGELVFTPDRGVWGNFTFEYGEPGLGEESSAPAKQPPGRSGGPELHACCKRPAASWHAGEQGVCSCPCCNT